MAMSKKAYQTGERWVIRQTEPFTASEAAEAGAVSNRKRVRLLVQDMQVNGHKIENISTNPFKAVYVYQGYIQPPKSMTWREVFRRMSNYAR